MTDLRQVFDDLVRFETILWGAIDARLQEECGIGLASLNAMLVIDATPLCRVHDIARAVAITVGGASQAVDRLESAGLCARRANPSDRRSSIVELTPRAWNSWPSPPPSSTGNSTACCGLRCPVPLSRMWPMPSARSAAPRLPRQSALRLAGPRSEARSSPTTSAHRSRRPAGRIPHSRAQPAGHHWPVPIALSTADLGHSECSLPVLAGTGKVCG